MLPIFKVYQQIKKDETGHIYVFLNNEWIEDNYNDIDVAMDHLDTAIDSRNHEKLAFIFSEMELTRIFANNIPVTFLSHTLHIDDTITAIKSKIIEGTGLSLSLPEIYLFAVHKEQFSPQSLYNKLTQNGEIVLTKERLSQFLQNFIDFNINDFLELEQEEFTYEDILPYTEEEKNIKFPLGQKIIIDKKYPFMVSPFDIFINDPILEKYGSKLTSTENENLFLQYGNIHSNIIFMATAENVLQYIKKEDISEEIIIKIYFPLLYNQKITSLAELKAKKQHLLATNKKLLDTNFKKYTNNIDLFYNIYYNEDIIVPIISQGIQYLHFIIHPLNTIHFPTDIIFKLIHATPNLPLLKWNPGKRRENIYRLYTSGISKDGRKIPSLPKSEILKIQRTVGRKKSVSMTIELNTKQYIICEFFDNGNLSIKCSFQNSPDERMILSEAEKLIKTHIQPILTKIKQYLEQSGYSYFEFENLQMPNIEIIDMTYAYSMSVTNINHLKDITDFQGCLSSIFNIMEDDKHQIALLYKRISHFNEMDSIEAFITYLHKHNYHPDDIIKKLMENFNLSHTDATLKYAEWVNERQVERDRFENKKFKIISNPGFPIIINWKTGHVDIIIEAINDTAYLKVLPIYLNSMIKLTQYEGILDSTRERNLTERIRKTCGTDIIQVQTVFNDIKASGEKKFTEQEEVSVDDGLITFEDSVDDDLMSMFGGDGDDDDDEDAYEDIESEVSSAPATQESSPPTVSVTANIDGLSLTNPNFFQKKLENADPILFLKKKQGKFKQYSRSCAQNIRRQPVVLTDAEFQKIKQESPDKIKMAMKYGSSDDKQFWYVCPQYWCLTTNTPITKQDMETAQKQKIKLCGNSTNPYDNIIPYNAKTIPTGKYIYSRVDFGQKERKQVRETLFPGMFIGKHPNSNLCIPCCFNKPGGKQMLNRQKCGAEVWNTNIQIKEQPPPIKTESKVIKESNKYPLEKGGWGYLPVSIYNFFNIPYANIDCNNDATTCILRKGVEYSPLQSFIAAIATIYNPESPLSIQQFKDRINKRVLSLDSFITYQYGGLVDLFKPEDYSKTIHPSYKKNEIYKKLIKTPLGKEYLAEIIGAFENFKRYLDNTTIEIDYEYLWDIICSPNSKLFPQGINLIILELPKDDITQKIDIICPSNQYATQIFHKKRQTAILLLRDGFYEPILLRRKITKGKDIVKALFSIINPECPKGCPWAIYPTIRKIAALFKKCTPITPSNINITSPENSTKIFKLKQNLTMKKINKLLKTTKYTIISQVINLHTKVIGLIVMDKVDNDKKIFLPCKPSPIITTAPFILAYEDTSWWQDYPTTVTMLKNLFELNPDKRIPCKPIFKVIDDGKIIGILTITNQFVPTLPYTPEDTYADSLIPWHLNNSPLQADKEIWSENTQDTQRLEIVKRVKLETNFYNTFRNTIRILLNQYKFKTIKEQIEISISQQDISYWQKLEKIILILKELLAPFVEFVELDIKNIHLISTCLNLEGDACNKQHCALSAGEGTCQLLIPYKNLISGNLNEKIYYGRMADELIRYGQIKEFILQPDKFISFQDVGYDLKDDEILLLEETIIDNQNNYFENLHPIIENKYVSNPRTFYNVEPHEAPHYTNEFSLNN